jgi:hypothetical protein
MSGFRSIPALAYLLAGVISVAVTLSVKKPVHISGDTNARSAAADAEFQILGLDRNDDIEAIHFAIQWNKEDPRMGTEAYSKAYRLVYDWLKEHPEYEKYGENPCHFPDNRHVILLVQKAKR